MDRHWGRLTLVGQVCSVHAVQAKRLAPSPNSPGALQDHELVVLRGGAVAAGRPDVLGRRGGPGWMAGAAPRRSTPGRQPRYPQMATDPVLTLRLAFHLALRQAEELARGVQQLLGLDVAVPDHTILSRQGALAGHQPRMRLGTGPVHLVLDSTGEVAAHMLTDSNGDDAAQAPALLHQCKGILASLKADGAYDRDPIHQAAARQQGSPPAVVIPPRANAVPSTADPDRQTPRDRHIRLLPPAAGRGGTRAAASAPAQLPGPSSGAARPACCGVAPAIPQGPLRPPRT